MDAIQLVECRGEKQRLEKSYKLPARGLRESPEKLIFPEEQVAMRLVADSDPLCGQADKGAATISRVIKAFHQPGLLESVQQVCDSPRRQFELSI
jgi:hypothetical protein